MLWKCTRKLWMSGFGGWTLQEDVQSKQGSFEVAMQICIHKNGDKTSVPSRWTLCTQCPFYHSSIFFPRKAMLMKKLVEFPDLWAHDKGKWNHEIIEVEYCMMMYTLRINYSSTQSYMSSVSNSRQTVTSNSTLQPERSKTHLACTENWLCTRAPPFPTLLVRLQVQSQKDLVDCYSPIQNPDLLKWYLSKRNEI